MNRRIQIVILAGLLGLMSAAWEAASAAEPLQNCVGLDCQQCEADLNSALASNLVTGNLYAFACGHDAGGSLSIAFSEFLNASPRIYADYDGFSDSCNVYASTGDVTIFYFDDIPLNDRNSINAWKKSLREVCRNY